MRRSKLILILAGMTAVLAVGVALARPATATAATPEAVAAAVAPIPITVYHSPTCGCCKEWVKHMEANGFAVKSIEQPDLSGVKAEMGVPNRLRSCHTAIVGGYVIEGHVPAADVKRLLTEKPKVVGLTIPGMPQSAPGMDSGKEPYEVLAWDAQGKTTSWAKHN